ncbi:hypothetical protein SASPL_115485 [Salvia splendens]|uniref:Hs1pro-1 C-terminal domain-containing protein n=1 Tax=Salvia splendens TaxID=180675 RepID=A0A8X8Y2L1_SALSN|nr:hypothetical protein SASPL_115485 [Salvia splendens]
MDVTRKELPDTMAAVRLSGMEISDLTMELSDNGSDSELFCFRSRELVEVTKSSKYLRHSVPTVLEAKKARFRGKLIKGSNQAVKEGTTGCQKKDTRGYELDGAQHSVIKDNVLEGDTC